MSQQALAEKLSTGQSNVANWEAGRYQPSPGQFIELSRIFDMEVEALAFMQHGGIPASFFNEKLPKGLIPTAISEAAVREAEKKTLSALAASGLITSLESPIRHIPLLKDSAAAGTPRAVDEDEIDSLIQMPRSWIPPGGEVYAIRVTGDSMSPILLDGHIVFVDTAQHDAKKLVNKMVIARDDGITVKWLREDDGEFLLVPNNISLRHPVRVLRKNRDIRIVGRVLKWIGEPPPTPKKR